MNSECENVVYPSGGRGAHKLEMKNGLPYLSKELFWMAMGDIVEHATLASGHSWQELREMLDNQAHEPQPQIYSVKAGVVDVSVHLAFHLHRAWRYQAWWTTWIQLMAPRMMRTKKTRSVRDQNLLLLDLPPVDHHTNKMRFEEGNDSEFQNAEEVTTRETDIGGGRTEEHGAGEIHGVFGSATL